MAKENKDIQLTSVNVKRSKFRAFKVESVMNKFSFHNLVDVAMDLFLTNSDQKKMYLNHKSQFTGSLV